LIGAYRVHDLASFLTSGDQVAQKKGRKFLTLRITWSLGPCIVCAVF